ncbi:helix-turn-helix domain-containing protein (plasmid) [Morganella morganii]|uniref:helix-turn-helix domain-containing protein n=1 Tax=Morganella morganii TaxID=582 RepID=UPI00386A51BC
MKIKSKDLDIHIGLYIKKTRKEKGLSGRVLAQKIGISQQQLSRYENGTTKLTFETVNEILLAFNKQWFHLFNEVIYKFDHEQMISAINKDKNYQDILFKIMNSE